MKRLRAWIHSLFVPRSRASDDLTEARDFATVRERRQRLADEVDLLQRRRR